jgi:outer membrane protein OmpA-like peptidoglycan-associated protein
MQLIKVFLLLILLPITAMADTITRKDYTHDTGLVVTTVRVPEYVITSTSSSKLNRLTAEPAPVLLAARFSRDVGQDFQLNPTNPALPPEPTPDLSKKEITPVVLLFDFDVATIRPADLARLAAWPANRVAKVTGYSCDLGSAGYNQVLSFRRAMVVAKAMVAHGVLVKKVEGKGECCPVDTEKKEHNRRVEITPFEEGQAE